MQHSIKLRLSDQQLSLLKTDSAAIMQVVLEVVPLHADQIGYMLQGYHPRQKASKVSVVNDTLKLNSEGGVAFNISYVLEEFSACSAVDTEDTAKMPVTVVADVENGILNLTGEYWPSLD